MLAYIDSSVLARAYLPDEPGHAEAAALLAGADHLLVTATWTLVEVTSALVRATRVGRHGDIDALLGVLATSTAPAVPVADRKAALSSMRGIGPILDELLADGR